jgi:hypothetical protein
MEPQEPDNLIGLIDQLQDIVEPARISMAPQTWAWAVVATLLLAALAAGGWAWLRHRRATAWRRAALAELSTLAPALEAGEPQALARLQTLLRRVALATGPRAEVAGLTGAGWAVYLERTGGDFGKFGATLADAPYRPVHAGDGRAALDAARSWIRRRHA